MIVTAHAREARNIRLDPVPVFGGSPASGNEDDCRKGRQLAVAIYGDAPLANAEHTLLRKGRQCGGHTKENGQYSRSVQVHIEQSDTALSVIVLVQWLSTLSGEISLARLTWPSGFLPNHQ